MAKKKLGHVELQWTCPNCGGINPGSAKTCQACGSPQPEDVQFEQAQRQELLTDEEKIEQAEAGADIHCPYCGTRNVATATVCIQCGGDLTEGTKRESGRVVGAFRTGPTEMVRCPRCGTENPDTAKTCSQCGAPMQREQVEPATKAPPKAASPSKNQRWILIGAVVALIVICALLYFAFFKTSETTGTVQEVKWERSIPILALVPVTYETWMDEVPPGADLGTCRPEERYVSEEPVPRATEVCGTPYNVDTGGGYAEVVQDCVYHVYDDYCSYSVQEWSVVNTVVLTGENYNAYWPEPTLVPGQRIGDDRVEKYVIIFDTGDKLYTFTTTDYGLFQRAKIGSTWTLEINNIGGVVRIEP